MAMIAGLSWADTTSFLLIEYDSQLFSDEFAVSLWAMDADGEPVNRDGHWFLKGRTVVVPSEIYDDEQYEAIEPWAPRCPSVAPPCEPLHTHPLISRATKHLL
jgi:hypothetical protein